MADVVKQYFFFFKIQNVNGFMYLETFIKKKMQKNARKYEKKFKLIKNTYVWFHGFFNKIKKKMIPNKTIYYLNIHT